MKIEKIFISTQFNDRLIGKIKPASRTHALIVSTAGYQALPDCVLEKLKN
jgi:hypothetical protein